MLNTCFLVGVLSVATLILGTGVVSGQQYPYRPLRIVSAEPGGAADFTARMIARGLAELLGQPVIVDNRAALVATETVAKAPPDGYTLLVMATSFWVTPLFQKKASYDPGMDFSPITLAVNSPNVLVVHPLVPIQSVKDLIALAKAKPGELNVASAFIGGSVYLSAELFKAMASVNIVNVPYKGSGAALVAVIGGESQLAFATPASAAPHIKSGKLRAVAVTSAQPSALFPDLPTVAATVPGYESGGASVMFAPAGTPVTIVSRLNREVVRLLNQADVKEKFFNVGVETVGSSPQQLAAMVKAEMARLSKVIKDAGIRLE